MPVGREAVLAAPMMSLAQAVMKKVRPVSD